MAVWLKRILIAVAALVALLAAAITVALMLVDTAALKRIASEQVEARTGRELVIEGEFGISVFPWIGFELGTTRLANAEGFDARPFASLERAELRVRVLPLLAGQVAVDRIVLHGLSLNLARNAAGRGNWADLVPESGSGPAAEPEPGPAAAESAPGAAIDLRIEGVEVRDASLAWHDAASGQEALVRGFDLETGALAPGEPTPVTLSVTLEAPGAPSVAGDLSTEATFDPAQPRLRLAGLRVELRASGDMLPGGSLAAAIGGDVDADLASGRITVNRLELGAAGVIEARGQLTADTAAATPALEGRLELTPFSPRRLLQALDLPLPAGIDDNALEQASGSFNFSAAGESARIDNLRLRLDDSRATGSASAAGGEIPQAEIRLDVDRIDLDRYLPAAQGSGGETGAAGGTAAAGDPVAELPLEAMRGVRARAGIGIGELSARGIEARNAELRLRVDDGVLLLERLGADIAGGALQLSGRLDGRTDSPAAGLDLKLDSIQSAPLLRAITGTTPVSGRLDAGIGLDTRGATLDDWIGALGGRIVTTFSDGAIEGINIAQRIRVALARFDGSEVEDAAQTRRTDFSRLHFAADVRDGVIHANELDLRAPLLRVGGDGRVDLARRRIDYTARVLVTGTLEGQGGASSERLKGLDIPLRISGPLTAPAFELAFADAMEARIRARKDALKQEAREAEREAKRKLEQKAEEEKARLKEKKKKKKEEVEKKLEKELERLFD